MADVASTPTQRRSRRRPHSRCRTTRAAEARQRRGASTSTTSASRRARCTSPSGSRRWRAGALLALDLDAVRAAPGVVAVLTAADIPGENDVVPAFDDDPLFADERGQLPRPGALRRRRRDRASRAPRRAARRGRDRGRAAERHGRGRARARRDACCRTTPSAAATRRRRSRRAPHRLEGQFRIGGQEHFYLEGQVALAMPGEDGDMLVYSSTQHPSEVQHVVARVLGLPDACGHRRDAAAWAAASAARRRQAAQCAAIAALAARVTGRPCKLRLDRDDDMMITGKRHDFRVDYEVGFDDDGAHPRLDVEHARRAAATRPTCPGAVDDRADVPRRQRLLPARRASIARSRCKTNTGLEHRVPRLRRAAGHDRDRARDRRDRLARSAAIRSTCASAISTAPGRDVTPYGMTVEDNILPALVDELEATRRLPRAPRGDRGLQRRRARC